MNDAVLDKIQEIIDYIKKSDNYRKYSDIRERLKNNKEVMSLIKDIKTLQKEAVNREHKGLAVNDINDNIKSKLSELNQYPIYCEFTYVQEDLNEVFQNIKNILENYVNSKTS